MVVPNLTSFPLAEPERHVQEDVEESVVRAERGHDHVRQDRGGRRYQGGTAG